MSRFGQLPRGGGWPPKRCAIVEMWTKDPAHTPLHNRRRAMMAGGIKGLAVRYADARRAATPD